LLYVVPERFNNGCFRGALLGEAITSLWIVLFAMGEPTASLNGVTTFYTII